MPADRLAALAAPLLDLLYPPSCVGCGSPLKQSSQKLCSQCAGSLPWIREGGCNRCGSEFSSAGRCQLCEHLNVTLSFVRSAVWFTDCVPELVHALKYGKRREMAVLMAELALASGTLDLLPCKPDLIVPVPLHWRRRIKRGFNQSVLLGRELSDLCGIALAGSGLIRIRATASQTRLNPEQRRSNVAGAFSCRESGRLRGKTVLIIDDVMTTGATLGEVASSLADAGARRVFGWTFARA